MRAEVNISEIMGRQVAPNRHLDGQNFRFYLHYKPNRAESEKEGRPIFEDVEFIEVINFAGEKTPRAIEERDIRAYPDHYAAFKATLSAPVSGTHLAEWCLMTPGKLKELEHFGCRTVEQVAALSDEIQDKFPKLKEWVRRATNWLTASKVKQAEVVTLKEQLHKALLGKAKLEEQLLLCHKRLEAVEGSSLVA